LEKVKNVGDIKELVKTYTKLTYGSAAAMTNSLPEISKKL
tara:strand:+ start:4094 stop:4213 length:120 start_codon:yes stop_codon:yes gene_type:complete